MNWKFKRQRSIRPKLAETQFKKKLVHEDARHKKPGKSRVFLWINSVLSLQKTQQLDDQLVLRKPLEPNHQHGNRT